MTSLKERDYFFDNARAILILLGSLPMQEGKQNV